MGRHLLASPFVRTQFCIQALLAGGDAALQTAAPIGCKPAPERRHSGSRACRHSLAASPCWEFTDI